MPHTSEEAKQRRSYLKTNFRCTICTANLGIDGGVHVKCIVCRTKHQKGYNDYRQRTKQQTFEAYGGMICACCGEKELAFLCIDHIHGKGNKERKLAGNKGGKTFYQWLKNQGYPEGYQVLCHNCNLGRYLNGGVCPHKI